MKLWKIISVLIIVFSERVPLQAGQFINYLLKLIEVVGRGSCRCLSLGKIEFDLYVLPVRF